MTGQEQPQQQQPEMPKGNGELLDAMAGAMNLIQGGLPPIVIMLLSRMKLSLIDSGRIGEAADLIADTLNQAIEEFNVIGTEKKAGLEGQLREKLAEKRAANKAPETAPLVGSGKVSSGDNDEPPKPQVDLDDLAGTKTAAPKNPGPKKSPKKTNAKPRGKRR